MRLQKKFTEAQEMFHVLRPPYFDVIYYFPDLIPHTCHAVDDLLGDNGLLCCSQFPECLPMSADAPLKEQACCLLARVFLLEEMVSEDPAWSVHVRKFSVMFFQCCPYALLVFDWKSAKT